MKQKHSQYWLWRSSGAVVAASLVLPIVGCGSKAPATTSAPPVTNTQARPSTGLSTKQKLVLLAGAAAMYYYYTRAKKANEAKYAGQNIQYYRSKNGRVYFRDPQNPQKVTWVTPPPEQVKPVELAPDQAQDYSEFQGYNNSPTGTTIADKFPLR